MKTLTEYKRNGYAFTLISRLGDHAIFRGNSGTSMENYEVIKIQSHQGREWDGVFCPPAEYPPSNNQWGTKGWTFNDRESAEAKFKQLTGI